MAKNYKFFEEEEALKQYLKQINQIPPLTPDEEKELARRIRKGDKEALKRLVEANLKFVVSIAKRYRGKGVPFMDLINEGNLGLIEAAKRFDPDRNVKFITYAVWWIKQAIISAIAEQSGIFKISYKTLNLLNNVGRKFNELQKELNRDPSPRELAEAMDIDELALNSLLTTYGDHKSLDDYISSDTDDLNYEDVIEQESVDDAETELIKKSFVEHLMESLSILSERERDVLIHRFGLNGEEPKTLQEIGKILNLSRERVRQIEKSALEKIRRSRYKNILKSYLN